MMFAPPYPSGLPIGAGWLPTAEQATVHFPYDGSPVAEAPLGSADLAHRALREALPPASADALAAARDAVVAERDRFADLLVLETGKPLVDCRAEVTGAIAALTGSGQPGGPRPAGPVVAVVGFNAPLLFAATAVAAALTAGAPVVVKPAGRTPLSTLWLAHLLRSAGAPPAAVQVVTGGAAVGEALVSDGRAGTVLFTGSAAVGRRIAAIAATADVRLHLAPPGEVVVAAHDDLAAAADAVVRDGYAASGQAGGSVQRVLVAAPVRDAFLARLVPRVERLVVGDPRSPLTRVAPLIDAAATGRVRGWVADAIETGATLVTGGVLEGATLRPTVLAGVRDGLHAWDEEIFGPVVCVR
jgi:acyl-CoA reductase-like NAD-dependent aldehyde dehydrogenase